MQFKIAIASTDGKVINEHFGRATQFYIVGIEGDTYQYIEKRAVKSCCSDYGHNNEDFDRVLLILKDCVAIMVSKIGDGASAYLESKAMTVFEAPYPIEDALNKIIEDDLLGVGTKRK